MTDSATRYRAAAPAPPFKLHIGGKIAKSGWTIFNAEPSPEADIVGDMRNLSRFADGSVAEIYASHVLEHVGHREIRLVLAGFFRVLQPGGKLSLSVPDLDVLCRQFLRPDIGPQDRLHIMGMIFGNQINDYEFHKVGLNWQFLQSLLVGVGFKRIERVVSLGLFADTSEVTYLGEPISLNARAFKPA